MTKRSSAMSEEIIKAAEEWAKACPSPITYGYPSYLFVGERGFVAASFGGTYCSDIFIAVEVGPVETCIYIGSGIGRGHVYHPIKGEISTGRWLVPRLCVPTRELVEGFRAFSNDLSYALLVFICDLCREGCWFLRTFSEYSWMPIEEFLARDEEEKREYLNRCLNNFFYALDFDRWRKRLLKAKWRVEPSIRAYPRALWFDTLKNLYSEGNAKAWLKFLLDVTMGEAHI